MAERTRKNKKYFERDKSVVIRRTPRDEKIIRLVYEHRFLSGDQIRSVVAGSYVGLSRRLRDLYHTGYLDRPRAQLRKFEKKSFIYALGREGARFIADEDDLKIGTIDWTSKNRNVGERYIEHTLMVADFMLTIQKACEVSGKIEFISPAEIINNRPRKARKGPGLKWSVDIKHEYPGYKKKGVESAIPDGAFGLRFPNDQVAYYFVEADRSKKPVKRSDLRNSNFYAKMVRFFESFRQVDRDKRPGAVFKDEFGFRSATMLTLTISRGRIKNLIEAQKQIDPNNKGMKMFLFLPAKFLSLDEPEKVLERVWINGQGDRVSLAG